MYFSNNYKIFLLIIKINYIWIIFLRMYKYGYEFSLIFYFSNRVGTNQSIFWCIYVNILCFFSLVFLLFW